MDGGFDGQITRRYGWQVQTELKKRISESELSELLVGQAELIKLPDTSKYLIYAPTMRVPTSHLVSDSVNAYLSMKAALLAAMSNDKIKSIVIPGLCTGTSKMNPEYVSKQMHAAYSEVIKREKLEFPTFMDASKHHFGMNPRKG